MCFVTMPPRSSYLNRSGHQTEIPHQSKKEDTIIQGTAKHKARMLHLVRAGSEARINPTEAGTPREPLINELTPVLVEIRGETHRSGLNEKG